MSNVGKIFTDLSTDTFPVYAVGKTGFMHLANFSGAEPVGEFIPYDSAFTSPEFFDNPVFLQVPVRW